MENDPKEYLTPKEVVFLLKAKGIITTCDTVRNWCVRGLQNKKRPERRHFLGSFKLGGRVMIIRSELLAFLPLLAEQGTHSV